MKGVIKMANLELWEQLKNLKSLKYKWIDLTHEMSIETPHWRGFNQMQSQVLFDFEQAPMKVFEYTFPGQYGTHVDAPSHFDPNGRSIEKISVHEFAYPLCVIDKSKEVMKNNDYALTIEDILDWEKIHGDIPEGAFVAFRSDWSKRSASEYDNKDTDGNAHYPGWEFDTVKWLVKQRKVGAIGHETSDTDPACVQPEIGFAAEDYILRKDRFQIELMKNLDQVPPVGAIIFCTFPKIKKGTGFPARCFAICPNE